jgi:hypothetical protein
MAARKRDLASRGLGLAVRLLQIDGAPMGEVDGPATACA